MIATSTKPQPFTPPWYKKGDRAPVFMIRAGNVEEREEFEAFMAGEYDAARVYAFELDQALERGIEALLANAPEQLEELRALLATEREIGEHNNDVLIRALGIPEKKRGAFVAKESRALTDADRQGLEEVRSLVHKHWPDYRALVLRKERRQRLAPLAAFRKFCTSWEGLDVPFAAGIDGLVTLEAAREVPVNDMKAAGLHAYQLLYAAASGEAEKN